MIKQVKDLMLSKYNINFNQIVDYGPRPKSGVFVENETQVAYTGVDASFSDADILRFCYGY